MAGRGPAPKAPQRRAGHSKDPNATTVLPFEPGEQPDLPDRPGPGDEAWPPATLRWWQMWGESAQATLFTATDWSELADAAILHAALWDGDTKVAAELRLRVAKFGATMEDRARLRIQFAQADEADAKRPVLAPSRQRYAGLRVMPPPSAVPSA